MNLRTQPRISRIRLILPILLCCTLLPEQGMARNGDDWVLVERFQSQEQKAQSGNASAMYELARMYELGRGTAPDMGKAVQWYEMAINKGQNDARAHLGVLYFEGRGIKSNLDKASELIRAAAKQGNPTGEFYLGKMYEHGKGVRRDPGQAQYWYKQAAKNGHYLAIAHLKELQAERASTQKTRRSKSAAPKESPATILKQTVLGARWERNGRPAGFLPSANAKCKNPAAMNVSCKSGEQKRNTGDALITFTTDATLGGFNNSDEFTVSYTNTVTKVKAVERPSLDGEEETERRKPNIPLGKQSVVHRLRCELKSIDKLVCVKDSNATVAYTRVK